MIVHIALTIFFGVLVSIHVAMNARVGILTGSPATANLIFWIVGAATSAGIAFLRPGGIDPSTLGKVPPTLLLAGIIGSSLALFNTWMIPRIGIAAFSLLIILGQLGTSAVMTRTGFLGTAVQTLPPSRILGLLLVAGGTALFMTGK